MRAVVSALLASLLVLLLAGRIAALSLFANPFGRDSFLASQNTRNAPASTAPGFSDQSAYVSLSSSGAAIALADFNQDRFVDLLMLDTKSLRRVSVMQWEHDTFSFRHVGQPVNLDVLPLAKALKPPFKKINAAHAADFGNDGRMDVLLMDGSQGIILFGDALANFNASTPVHVPELPSTSAIMDADGDLVPEIFVAFDNGTRGFYKYHRNVSVNENRFDQRGVLRFHEWTQGFSSCDGQRALVPDAQSLAFADMDGDCLPDLVIGTSCGAEVWLNRAQSHTPFWELGANSSDVRVFNRSVFDFDGGDHAMTAADMDSDGTMDLMVANKKRRDLRVHRNKQQRRVVGQLCSNSADWHFETVEALGANELAMKDARLGSLFGGIAVANSLRVGDMDLDGWSDVLTVDAATSQPVVFRNEGGWDHGGRLRRIRSETLRGLQRGNGGAVAVGWFDTDESGRQDVVVVRGNETRLMWNFVGGERMFFKGTVLSGLGFRLEPRPFAPVVGNTVKLSYAERGERRRRRRVCSQRGGGAWGLEEGSCVFGLGAIANYVEELWVGGGAGTRAWTSLMPNSMAVVWAEGGGADGGAWWMEYFTQRRGGPMLRVVGALLLALCALGAAIGVLQRAEHKRDRADAERVRERLWGFA
eukprot:TRINITY_DN498_c1_g1_i1.p1 TRINITY_DN498_c1_g1~~TRINITY_DN498_c1_g1_i1.p1  ORF type:complete len:645 (+),score=126.31 TRINITY_DN498_c1_g1_i1:203-2137(+)